MAIVAYDDVQETCNTTGSGDRVLAGVVAGYRTFGSCCADLDQFSYTIRDPAGGTNFESGIGRYNSGANSITPLEITASSNAGAVVNFPAGAKTIYMTQLAKQIKPIGVFPFKIADGLLWRWASMISRTDINITGYATKGYDISGNGRDTFSNTTNPPKWVPNGFNEKFHAVYFNGFQKWMVNGMPSIASPFAATIYFVGQGFISGGNSHIYNWAGNPIGFGATTPLDLMYNGTLPAAHGYAAGTATDIPNGGHRYPVIGIHVYNGASSIQSLNGVEETKSPGTVASGTTNNFTIASDSSSGVGGGTAQTATMVLAEMGTLSAVLNATQRAALLAYLRAYYEIPGPASYIPPFGL